VSSLICDHDGPSRRCAPAWVREEERPMPAPADYRQYAHECMDSARAANSEAVRTQFLELAQLWLAAATDWSERVAHLVTARASLSTHAMVLGEVVVQTPEGRSDFHALEKELRVKGGAHRIVYYVFDVLYFGGFDLPEVPQLDCKRVLQALLNPSMARSSTASTLRAMDRQF
jgi:hypothetical protein